MTHDDAVRERFAATAEQVAAASLSRLDELSRKLVEFVDPRGDERALDVGAGAAALGFALAPHVREVTALELVPELLDHARPLLERFPNVALVEGDAAHMPFELGQFDLVCERAVLHHVPRPELVIAEMTRVTRRGGRLLVIDQLAPFDPLEAFELDRFERARDPTHTRLLSDGDLRALFEANGLMLARARVETQERGVDHYLDHAGCHGDDREHARALAPSDPYPADLGWYLLRRL